MPSVVLNSVGFGDYWKGMTKFPAILTTILAGQRLVPQSDLMVARNTNDVSPLNKRTAALWEESTAVFFDVSNPIGRKGEGDVYEGLGSQGGGGNLWPSTDTQQGGCVCPISIHLGSVAACFQSDAANL